MNFILSYPDKHSQQQQVDVFSIGCDQAHSEFSILQILYLCGFAGWDSK